MELVPWAAVAEPVAFPPPVSFTVAALGLDVGAPDAEAPGTAVAAAVPAIELSQRSVKAPTTQ